MLVGAKTGRMHFFYEKSLQSMECRADFFVYYLSSCKPRSNASILLPYSIAVSNSKASSGVRRKRMREPTSDRMKPDAFSKACSDSARSRSLPSDVI